VKNYFVEVNNIKSDGTYLITDSGIVDYAERWSYGYVVRLRELDITDLKTGTLFQVRTDSDSVQYALVRHVDAIQDATALALDFDQNEMYGLFEQEVIYL